MISQAKNGAFKAQLKNLPLYYCQNIRIVFEHQSYRISAKIFFACST